MSCLNHNIRVALFIVSSIFSLVGLGVSASKLFLSDNPTSESLYISIFTSIITLWLPSPSQTIKTKRQEKKLTELPVISSRSSSPGSSDYS